MMGLAALPLGADAAVVQAQAPQLAWDEDGKVLESTTSTDGSAVTSIVRQLLPGNYTFTCKVVSKTYDVDVTVTGTKIVDKVLQINKKETAKATGIEGVTDGAVPYREVSITFDVTDNAEDITFKLVGEMPGEPGATFSVSEAKLNLNYDFQDKKD